MVATLPSIEYLAGFLDADGYITIEKTKRSNRKGLIFTLKIGVVNTKNSAVGDFQKVFECGSINLQRLSNPKWNSKYTWSVGATKALNVLIRLYPYLRLKKEQARIGIIFQLMKKDGRRKKLPDEELKFRNGCVKKMRKLNKRGRET